MLSGRLVGAARRQGGPAEARQGRSELELLVRHTLWIPAPWYRNAGV